MVEECRVAQFLLVQANELRVAQAEDSAWNFLEAIEKQFGIGEDIHCTAPGERGPLPLIIATSH